MLYSVFKQEHLLAVAVPLQCPLLPPNETCVLLTGLPPSPRYHSTCGCHGSQDYAWVYHIAPSSFRLGGCQESEASLVLRIRLPPPPQWTSLTQTRITPIQGRSCPIFIKIWSTPLITYGEKSRDVTFGPLLSQSIVSPSAFHRRPHIRH
jgi:hypothetical protein